MLSSRPDFTDKLAWDSLVIFHVFLNLKNGDPKTDKGPHGDPGPQMGTLGHSDNTSPGHVLKCCAFSKTQCVESNGSMATEVGESSNVGGTHYDEPPTIWFKCVNQYKEHTSKAF